MSVFIKEHGKCSEDEITALLEKYSGKTLFCIYTTHFCCTNNTTVEDTKHLLELRLFDENSELKAVRANIGQPFFWRYITDEDVPDDCTYDELQYLDIDKTKTGGTEYVSIGGGHYQMPREGLERVLIRHYGEYDSESGMFSLKDFRIVKFQ